MVRRGLEESCARLAGKRWSSGRPNGRTAERVREALRGLGGSIEVGSYRGTVIERRWHVGQHGKRRYLSSLVLSHSPVCTENLNPNVLTMKSAQYGARIYDAGSLNLARDRRILVQ